MNNEIQTTRTPEAIAGEINGIKAQAGAVMVSALSFARRSVFEIGKRLVEAKSLLPHGEWGKWLTENVDYSESTANNIMRCYREFGDEQIDMLSGVSDAEFFGSLSQSQMVELFALPKPERREFVEEHRAALESGEMSVRDLKDEIARLKKENERQAKAHKKQGEELAALKALPAPEPVVQEVTVTVNQPSEEQMAAVRAKVAKQLRAEFDREREAIHEEYGEKIKDLEEARDEAIKDAAHTEDLETKMEKAEQDHKTAVDKLKADYEKKLATLEESYKKQAKASAVGGDADVVRVQLALEAFRREVRAVAAVLSKLAEEGQAPKAVKLRAQVERTVGALLADAGWTV